MKTTRTTFSIARKFGRLFCWAAFAAALCSILAMVAVMTGWPDAKLVKLAPSANEAWQYYANAGNADMSVIFDVR